MKIELWGGGEATFVADVLPQRPSNNTYVINMATYMMLKVDFQNLLEIEIFRKSKDNGWMLI